MPDLTTLANWRDAYRNGADPRTLLQALRQRLSSDSPAEAWITLTDEAYLDQQLVALTVRAGTDPAAAMAALPLYGVPFAVKDNIDVAGLPITAACPAHAHLAASHAHCVARLVEAGAVCMGKTNLDQFATGLVGARSPFGRPSSTWSAAHISGGSSSGSAVVVSRGDVPFALGTDTAGSGRVPAGFNHIVGLKPTPGRVGTSGVLPACRTIDCVSVFALTADDAAEVLAVMEGPDTVDAYSDFRTGSAHFGSSLRIGIPMAPEIDPDNGYAEAYVAAVEELRGLGHTVVPIDFAPLHAVAQLLYDGPWVAERHVVLQTLLERDPDALDPTVRRVVQAALGKTATETFRAQYTLRQAQRDQAALWQQVDLLMVPTTPGHPRHVDIDADPVGANSRLGVYTNFVNLLGWCALAMPAGLTAKAMPFGVTFIAPGAADAALAVFGAAWQRRVDQTLGATRLRLADVPPRLRPASRVTMPIAVVGAHLSGLPLNGQLTERGATLREVTQTTPRYRLYALPNTTPPKPGMQRVDTAGVAIAVEVWDMPVEQVGSFLGLIPPPLGLGSIELADGRWVHGFQCEAHALRGARDVSAFGGWRAYMAAGGQAAPSGPAPDDAAARIAAHVDACAATLGLTLAPEHRPGVLGYFALATAMANDVMAQPLAIDDEPAAAFRPVEP